MTAAAAPRLGDDWLRSRADHLAAHLHDDHAILQPHAWAGVGAMFEAHYAAHRVEGSDPHALFPGEPLPPLSRARLVESLHHVGLIDPARVRRRLEDAFMMLNPDFGVVPEHDHRGQRDLAWRREQAITLGPRVLVDLRAENSGPAWRRRDVIRQRGDDARCRARLLPTDRFPTRLREREGLER
ncbi:MAG: hypothetical protein ACRDZO_11200 [Egibacteraceae bacterium]